MWWEILYIIIGGWFLCFTYGHLVLSSLTKESKFRSDDEISSHWFWRLMYYLVFPLNNFLHRIEFIGGEKVLNNKTGVLTIHLHSTHNCDILFGILSTHKHFGRVARGLIHRQIMFLNPLFQYIGLVAGYRTTATDLLNEGYIVSVIPGGAEEALTGHENSYKLTWPENRTGFVKVALSAGVPIVPIFYQNVEEMRWNPIFSLWNLIKGYKLFNAIVAAKIPIVSKLVKFLGEYLWFNLAFLFGIWVPVKVTGEYKDTVSI